MFLGYSVSRQQNISEQTVQKIDAEIKRLVEEGYGEAKTILTERRADLETLAKGLLEYGTLSGEEIKELLAGKPPVREGLSEPVQPRASAVPPTGKTRPRPSPAAWAAAAGVSDLPGPLERPPNGGRFAAGDSRRH